MNEGSGGGKVSFEPRARTSVFNSRGKSLTHTEHSIFESERGDREKERKERGANQIIASCSHLPSNSHPDSDCSVGHCLRCAHLHTSDCPIGLNLFDPLIMYSVQVALVVLSRPKLATQCSSPFLYDDAHQSRKSTGVCLH